MFVCVCVLKERRQAYLQCGFVAGFVWREIFGEESQSSSGGVFFSLPLAANGILV